MTKEEVYEEFTDHEHVLKKPSTYIGTISNNNMEFFTCNGTERSIIKKNILYNQGLFKIFDEPIVNAIDHSVKHNTVTKISIEVNKQEGWISIINNGPGIPVKIQDLFGKDVYIPEMVSCNLRTSSNYDDSKERIVGGTNGFGLSLTNIFSKRFIIETLDSTRKLYYRQEITDNMYKIGKPEIKSSAKSSYTKITFYPYLKKFKLTSFSDDLINLMKKRVYDIKACVDKKVQIYFNNENINIKDFADYTSLYFNSSQGIVRKPDAYEKFTLGDYTWEVAAYRNNEFQQVSFVNSVNTLKGGKHVEYILKQISKKLLAVINSKKKIENIKAKYIEDHLFLFVRATINQPEFTSQTKEELGTPASKFFADKTMKIEISDAFINKLYKCGLVQDIINLTNFKNQKEITKTDGSKKVRIDGITKLSDAGLAGTKKGIECTLILVEGDSGKENALQSRSVLGSDKYGVFPLKGKCTSEDTKIPLWNGNIKLAKDIEIGDSIIGDDGNIRQVLTLFKGHGKMYEISQDRGESYKVNDEHILTLCIPNHKSIYWSNEHTSWRALYWDKITQNIKVKDFNTFIKIECNECGLMLGKKSLKRHYKRQHKDVIFEKSKTFVDMNDIRVIDAYKKLQDFLLTIDDNNIIDINIQDYLNLPKSFQRILKGIRGECVNWNEKEVLLDPYVLGLWLGDGMESGYAYACDGKNDYQIIDYLKEWGLKNDANLNQIGKNKYTYSFSSIDNFRKMDKAPLKKLLANYNLVNNKHIPKEYLVNSKEIRLKLLAGIIDSDGTVYPDGTIEISQSFVHKQLAEDITYLSRSLGFYTHVKEKITNYTYIKTGKKAEAYIIKIAGNTKEIPTILPRKKSKSTTQYNMRNSTGIIKIKEIDDCNYVGIGIDCNNRFLINDFTITHNCLNVRNASVSQLLNNEELNNIKTILGLKQNEVYKTKEDLKKLRYGKVVLFTDSDVDGSHIKCLFINFIDTFWKDLKSLDFIQTIKTPIVKATKGKKIIEFFTQQDYEKQKDSLSGYNIKYYKGIGTSKTAEAKEIFKRKNELQVTYYRENQLCDQSILLAFDKDKNAAKTDSGSNMSTIIKCSDQRKEWLRDYNKDDYLDVNTDKVSFSDLINKELKHFSIYDNQRSIPSLCDGLKPSTRKILYYMLKKNITSELKVAQLSG